MNSPYPYLKPSCTAKKYPYSTFLAPALCVLTLSFLGACSSSSSTPTDADVAADDGGAPTVDVDPIDSGAPTVDEDPIEGDTDNGTTVEGTIASSPEALMSFMLRDDGPDAFREFWLCTFSDNSTPTYIVFDSTDDAADPGFNPLLVLGKTRDAIFPDDPRGFNRETESSDGIINSIQAVVTSSDSMMVEVFPGIGVTQDPTITFDFTTIRLGPGRKFTSDITLNNLQLDCTGTDIPGVDVMF